MSSLRLFYFVPALLVCIFLSKTDGGIVEMPGYGLDRMDSYNISNLKSLGDEAWLKAMVPFYVEEFLKLFQAHPVEEFIDKFLLVGVESEQCKGHVLEWVVRFANLPQEKFDFNRKDLWVLHMIDSWGKPPEGLLQGHINALGDFDECVDIEVTGLELKNSIYQNVPKNLEGRYCNTYLLPYSKERFGHHFPPSGGKQLTAPALEELFAKLGRKAVSPERLLELISITIGVLVLPSIGICMPASCDQKDMEKIMVNAFSILYGGVDPNHPEANPIWPAVEHCYIGKKPDLDAGDISVITLLLAIIVIVAISTTLDISLNRGIEKPPRRGLAFQYLNSFSLFTNIPKWLSTRPSADDLGCIHGIRFLSTSYVILAHTWYVITFVPYWNMVDVKLLQEDWMILTILNSTVSVDTFFVLSGLLVSYNVLKMLHKTKGKLNIPMFYLHRYLRLTPVYAVLVGVMATLVPYVGRGPYWFIMDRWAGFCETNWWTNLLYVNNFVNTSWLCQGEAWYLANDMQFYLVSPLFLYPLYQWEMMGVILLAVATILSTLSPALMVHFMDTVPTTIGTRDSAKWFLNIYIKPYARIQTYFVGIWLGWILFKTKGKRVQIPIPIVLLNWIVAFGTCAAVLYGITPWFDPGTEIPDVPRFFYAGLNRLAWAISVSWIIFACVKGYGGLVNDFLSWKAFMPLGRICYCCFLVSLHLQMVLHIGFNQPIAYSEYTMVNFFFGHMIMSFGFGFIFTIMIETPFMHIEKLLFEGGGPRREPTPPVKPVEGERNGIFYNQTNNPIIPALIVNPASEKKDHQP